MITEDFLLNKYGTPLLTLAQAASIFSKSTASFRIGLRGNSDWAKTMKSGIRKIGRRTYVHVSTVAKIIDSNSAGS